jgi:hypothetical protein
VHIPFLIEPGFSRKQVAWRCAVLVLLVGIVPLWALRPGKQKAVASCPDCLAQLDEVITCWAVDNGKGATDIPSAQDLTPYFVGGRTPVCPDGGQITLGTDAVATRCTIHDHASLHERVAIRVRSSGVWQKMVERFRLRSPGVAKTICLGNLRQIDGATGSWALTYKQPLNTPVSASAISLHMKNNQFPVCPHGGKYVLGTVKDGPACTLSALGHTY